MENENEKQVDKEMMKRIVKRANTLTFFHTLEVTKGIDNKLEAMKDLARSGVLQSMDREGINESTLEFIDEMIEEYGQNPTMTPVDEWD